MSLRRFDAPSTLLWAVGTGTFAFIMWRALVVRDILLIETGALSPLQEFVTLPVALVLGVAAAVLFAVPLIESLRGRWPDRILGWWIGLTIVVNVIAYYFLVVLPVALAAP